MKPGHLLVLLSAALCTSVYSSRFRKFFTGPKNSTMNWTDAQAFCRDRGTDLFTVHGSEENEELVNAIQKKDHEEYHWIGLKRNKTRPKWSNGDAVNFGGQNCSEELTTPHCAALTSNGSWEILECKMKKYFMCYGKGDNYTIVREKKTWYEAQNYCRNNHIDLVSIRNESHNAEVRERGNIISPFWIGLMCDSWEWTDGASSTFRDWDKSAEFTQDKNCTYMKKGSNWRTLECINAGIPVCSQENFVLIDEKLTWEDALNYCNDHHSGLLRIESKEDQEAVEEELRCKCVTWPVWLGLRQSRLFGFWIWANGMPVQWSNWEGGRQPEQPLSHACGAMVTTGEGEHKWRDQNCLYKHHFLCENKSNETS